MASAVQDRKAHDPDWARSLPMLDDLQAGSLRRIFNLADQLPDDWSGMLGKSTLQEDFGALRFQLAYMSYTLALTHTHRLPAASGLFRGPFDALIQKTLSPDVWLYWHYVSTGNGPFNQSLGELPPQWNPVETDNIMYSAYVQSMALLYHYLFDDAKYAQPGALTFSINPLFWGLGGKHFPYDEKSLNDKIYWDMVERGYLGIACEPNCVFQICNQVPILGFRFHDLVYGGSTAAEVTEGYLKAWAEFGLLTDQGSYTMMVQERERVAITPPAAPWADFWNASLMHAWNPGFVAANYPRQRDRWKETGPDGTLWIRPAMPLSNDQVSNPSARDFGWAAVCASEVGDTDTLERLLAYADRLLQPVWTDGGYHYRRRDRWLDDDGRLAAMDPHTGNALLPYARLNVPGGLRRLYAGTWHDAHFSEPFIAEIAPDSDVRRAVYDPERRALVITLSSGLDRVSELSIGNGLDRGRIALTRDGEPHHWVEDTASALIRIALQSGHGLTTLVLTWA